MTPPQRKEWPVPLHLRNAPTPLMRNSVMAKTTSTRTTTRDSIVAQEHLPKELAGRKYYSPSESGYEKEIKERIQSWGKKKKGDKG
ncbi:MAG TPA: hypothetical protein VJ646_00165 [Candidatus Binatia bacterium]|nr:hypothetical protein [Candidatus Binatia bacterium]